MGRGQRKAARGVQLLGTCQRQDLYAVDKPKILTAKELRAIMPRLSGWKFSNNKLSRTFEFQDFIQSLSFVNSLVVYFETVDHHPDVQIAYGEVTFELTRYDVGARSLTEMWRWRRKSPPCIDCERRRTSSVIGATT